MAERRTRILLVTRNLPPLLGGMERLNWHLADELSRYAQVRIVAPRGSGKLAPADVEVREAPLAPLWKFLLVARRLARHEAQCWQPDVVLAGSGLAAPLARSAARLCHARMAVYVHGLDVAVRHPLYRAAWLPAIRDADRVVANSHATAALCRAARVDASRIGVVHPGVALPVPVASRAVVPDPALIDGHPVLLSVGRLSARKGVREFVACALPTIVAAYPHTTLLIVGDAPYQALHASAQTPESIRAVAAAAGVGENLKFLGAITDDAQLGNVYRAADVHVFPVREIPGDPEGFGMVAVEAAAHGLPTVAFATGGVVDAVTEGRSGHLVAAGDYAAFAQAVLRTLDEREDLRAACQLFARQFAWPLFGRQVAEQLGIV